MKIKSFLIAIIALVFSCSAFSQDSTKTMHHHTTGMHKHHHKHLKEGSKADKKEDKKERMEKKSTNDKKMDKKVEKK